MPSTKKAASKPTEPKQPAANPGAALFDATEGSESPPKDPAEPAPSSDTSEGNGDGPTSPEPAPEPAPPADPAPEPKEPEAPAPDQASSDGPISVRLGQAEGLLHRLPIGAVQELFADMADRIEVLRHSPSIALLQDRMRATEGRCAPVIATLEHEVENAVPKLFAGIESVAAAINLGLEYIHVITLTPDDAGAVQRHLVNNANGRPLSSTADAYEVIR